jgi:hypothetical protein
MAIEDLTSQLKQLKEHGEPDLQLSDAVRDEYVRIVSTFRGALQDQLDKVNGLRGLGHPGDFESADETKRRLIGNIQNTDGIITILTNYIDYLNEFEATVNAAYKRLHGEDSDTGTGEVLHA